MNDNFYEQDNLLNKEKDSELQNILHNIIGIWRNPINENKYFFSSSQTSKNGFGELKVLQQSSNPFVALNYKIIRKGGEICILLEDACYPIKLKQEEEKTLIIQIEKGHTMRLVK